MMKTCVKEINDRGVAYTALMFCCPGCALLMGNSGLHMLAVNSPQHEPSWDWDGNFESPTLSPSILTRYNEGMCHSFLRNGVFEFLGDCTHPLAGQTALLPDLPSWVNE